MRCFKTEPLSERIDTRRLSAIVEYTPVEESIQDYFNRIIKQVLATQVLSNISLGVIMDRKEQ